MSDTTLIQVILDQIASLDGRLQSSISSVSTKVDSIQDVVSDMKALQAKLVHLQDTLDQQEEKIDKALSWQDKIDGKIVGVSGMISLVGSAIAFFVSNFFRS